MEDSTVDVHMYMYKGQYWHNTVNDVYSGPGNINVGDVLSGAKFSFQMSLASIFHMLTGVYVFGVDVMNVQTRIAVSYRQTDGVVAVWWSGERSVKTTGHSFMSSDNV